MVFRSFKYRRFSALFLDLVLVSIVTSLLFSNSISNPYYNDYLSISEEYTKVITEVSTVNTQSMDDMQNYINRVSDISYRYSKVNIFYCIWYVVLCFLYFVLFQYSTGGKTLGKKFYKLRVCNKEDNKKISIGRLIGKTLLTGEIYLFNGIVLVALLDIVGILLISDATVFFFYTALCNLIGIVIEVAMIVSFFKNKNKETIADKIFKTKVIEVK